jgi:hypothetical protein
MTFDHPARRHREKNRVHLALLKTCGGDIGRLRGYVRGAQADYRDTLVAAEYPEEGQASPKTPASELGEIRKRDREQYEAWLQSDGA